MLFSFTALLPNGSIWVGTNNGNVIAMDLHVKSATTKGQPRTVELCPNGMLSTCSVCLFAVATSTFSKYTHAGFCHVSYLYTYGITWC